MYEFKLPDLGEGVHEGEVLKWHVQVGGTVAEDAPLVDIETDKAAVTIPSPRGGKVVALNGKVGEIVHVGTVIAVIDDGTGPAAKPAATPATASAAAPTPPAAVAAANPNGNKRPAPAVAAAPANVAVSVGRKAIAAPATRRLARENHIDINQVIGSGPAGRVTSDDVLRYVNEGGALPGGSQIPSTPVDGDESAEYVGTAGAGTIPLLDVAPLEDFAKYGPIEKEALRSIRRKVARKMVTSLILTPHAVHMDEADVTELDEVRRLERERYRKNSHPGGSRLTLLAFIVKAVVAGLKRVPVFNASVDAVREEIIYKKFYNIGIAVDTGQSLVVPVLRDADKLSVIEIAERIADLADRARTGKLDQAEFKGGTFTISNMGPLGGTNLIPVINHPESGILGVGRVQEKPVVRDGEIVIRKILPLTLSLDHRVADGANAAAFVGFIVNQLTSPITMLIEG